MNSQANTGKFEIKDRKKRVINKLLAVHFTVLFSKSINSVHLILHTFMFTYMGWMFMFRFGLVFSR